MTIRQRLDDDSYFNIEIRFRLKANADFQSILTNLRLIKSTGFWTSQLKSDMLYNQFGCNDWFGFQEFESKIRLKSDLIIN